MTYSRKTIICNESINIEILNETSLKLVVLNNFNNFVEMADSVAQQTPMGFERRIVWVKNKDIEMLKNQFSELPDEIENIIAFSLSTINKVAFILNKGDTINSPRIDRAFIKAGKTKYN